NNGPAAATSVSLTDTFPGGFNRGTVTPSQGTCTGTPSFTCSLGSIASGGSATVTVNYTVPSSTTADQTNTASVSSAVADPVSGNNSASDTNSINTSADLSITKTDGVTSVTAGAPTVHTYTITVANLGRSDATGVSLSDTFPGGFTRGTVTPSQGTCTGSPSFTCSLGTIAKNGIARVTVNYTVPSSTPANQTITASVSSAVSDPDTSNNSASDTDTITTSADLSVTKSDGVTTVTAGAATTHTYTITVSNAGPSDATGVSLSH